MEVEDETLNDWIVVAVKDSKVDLIIIDLPSLHLRLANREPSAYELWMALFTVYKKMEGEEYFEDEKRRWYAFKIDWTRSMRE